LNGPQARSENTTAARVPSKHEKLLYDPAGEHERMIDTVPSKITEPLLAFCRTISPHPPKLIP